MLRFHFQLRWMEGQREGVRAGERDRGIEKASGKGRATNPSTPS